MARPAYQVYSDDLSFSIKSIAPEFRVVGGGMKSLVLDKKGKLMLEWVPKTANQNTRFAWDKPLRFALSPEEVGLVLTRMRQGKPVEIHRRNPNNSIGGSGGGGVSQPPPSQGGQNSLKVFRVEPLTSGGVRMVCDYEFDGQGGQLSPEPNESQGPLMMDLLVGETEVIQSILEYSMPRLTGWTVMLDQSIDHALKSSTDVPDPHTYGNVAAAYNGNVGVPF